MRIGICCIVKQENLYLRDWVKYYYDMGVSKIVLYDNNDINGEYPQQVIGDYIADGFVEYIDARGKYRYQIEAYQQCYESHKTEFDWIGFLDIDEYWYLSPELSFEDFFSEERFPNAVGIFLSWLCYGDDNHLHYENKPVYERFIKPSLPVHSTPNAVKKCFVKCDDRVAVEFIDANGFNSWSVCEGVDFTSYTADGDFFRNELKWVYENSFIKHYRTLTIDEFLCRRFGRRGYADLESPQQKEFILNMFWEQNEWTDEKQKIIDEFFKDFDLVEDVPENCPYL